MSGFRKKKLLRTRKHVEREMFDLYARVKTNQKTSSRGRYFDLSKQLVLNFSLMFSTLYLILSSKLKNCWPLTISTAAQVKLILLVALIQLNPSIKIKIKSHWQSSKNFAKSCFKLWSFCTYALSLDSSLLTTLAIVSSIKIAIQST